MKQSLLAIFVMLLAPLLSFSQSNKEWLIDKFKNADTILLVSHKVNAGITITDDKTYKEIPLPELIVNGRPNGSIIIEEQVVKGKDIDALLQILTQPGAADASKGTCFIPRQSIFLLKNGQVSFIDISFSCHSYKTSTDLKDIGALGENQWKALEDYFIKHGLTYNLGEPLN
jgi:hypothetical protein